MQYRSETPMPTDSSQPQPPSSAPCAQGNTPACPAFALLQALLPAVVDMGTDSAKGAADVAAGLGGVRQALVQVEAGQRVCASEGRCRLADIIDRMNAVLLAVRAPPPPPPTAWERALTYLFARGSGPAILRVLLPFLAGALGVLGGSEVVSLLKGSP